MVFFSKGLMTIGAFGYNVEQGPNPDFLVLMDIYKSIYKTDSKNIIISMGMSDDFEHAVR